MWGGRPRLSGWACGQPIAMKTLWGGNFARSRLSAGLGERSSPALPRVAARQAGCLRHEGRCGSWVFDRAAGLLQTRFLPSPRMSVFTARPRSVEHSDFYIPKAYQVWLRRPEPPESRLRAKNARPPKRPWLFVGGDAGDSLPYHQRMDVIRPLVSLDRLQVT